MKVQAKNAGIAERLSIPIAELEAAFSFARKLLEHGCDSPMKIYLPKHSMTPTLATAASLAVRAICRYDRRHYGQ